MTSATAAVMAAAEAVAHDAVATAPKPEKKCPFCKYTSDKTWNLNRHTSTCEKKASASWAFICSRCGSRFARNYYLLRHERHKCKYRHNSDGGDEEKKDK